ncbi:MAG TPA: hemolysin family protein [Parasegetibacter sp.]
MEIFQIFGVVGTTILIILLFAFFAGLEMAFVSANKLNIELKKKQGKRNGIILSRFMDEPSKFIGTCLIGLNLMLVIYGLLVSAFMDNILWSHLEINIPVPRLILDVILATIIILVVEFLFKAIFRAKADSLLYHSAGLVQFFHNLFYPVAAFFVSISEWILKYLFNVRINENKEAFSRVDLEHFYQQSRETGGDESSEDLDTELFEKALSLPGVRIRQCLVPRKEIEGIESGSSVEEARAKFINTKLSKLVVYEENIDHIIGYVHQLDLFKGPSDIQSILHPIPAVPESMSAIDLISKFSRERKSIAWVVDEFGGTAGIVTMEDLLEEIFGEIDDEYDTEKFVEKQISNDEYIFSGRLELDYLNEKYGFDFPEEESETLSGFIINHHETIPKLKERIIIENMQFDILNVSDTRIEMVKMKELRKKNE